MGSHHRSRHSLTVGKSIGQVFQQFTHPFSDLRGVPETEFEGQLGPLRVKCADIPGPKRESLRYISNGLVCDGDGPGTFSDFFDLAVYVGDP